MVFVDSRSDLFDGGPGRDQSVDGPPPPEELSPVSSGTRLEALQIVVDGLSVWTGRWLDSQLGVECSFAVLPDQTARCLPRPTLITNRIYYEDANCSGPTVLEVGRTTSDIWQACNTSAAARVVQISSSACLPETMHGLRSRVAGVFTAGARIQPARIYFRSENSCLEGATASTVDYFRATELDLTTFARATPETAAPRAGARLASVDLVAEDGARERIAYWDTARQERCELVPLAGAELRCLPTFASAISYSWVFSDATCTTNASWGASSSCGETKYLWQYEANGSCRADTPYFVAGPRLGSYYSRSAGQCRENQTTMPVIAAGEAIASSSFASAALVVGTELGRIKTYRATLGVSPEPSSGLWDSQLGVPCNFKVAGDGTLRCLPAEHAFYPRFYSDAACLEPVAESECALTNTPYLLIGDRKDDGCQYRRRVYERGPALAPGATIYEHITRDNNVECVVSTPSSAPYLYSIGKEVAPALFAQGDA